MVLPQLMSCAMPRMDKAMSEEKDMTVEAINIARGLALMSDGSFVPITNHIDANGDECEPEDAEHVVAGPDADGRWWLLVLKEYDGTTH